MAVKTFSLARDGNTQLSANFRVREFRSRDGADKILIDMRGAEFLQHIRNWAGAPVNINSGFRTAAHNRAVGGSANSLHMQGRAWDIAVTGRTPLQVAQFAEREGARLGVNGIVLYNNFVHLDTRDTRFFGRHQAGRITQVSTFGAAPTQGNPHPAPTTNLRRGDRGDGVRWVQQALRNRNVRDKNGDLLVVDGSFGPLTESAVRSFQRSIGLSGDGIVGPITRERLR